MLLALCFFLLTFRMLEVPYDDRFYPSKVLTAIFSAKVIKHVYTWPGWQRTCSKKEPLPEALQRVIIACGKHTLKGKKMTLQVFLDRVRQRFSSWKIVSFRYIYICIYIILPLPLLAQVQEERQN